LEHEKRRREEIKLLHKEIQVSAEAELGLEELEDSQQNLTMSEPTATRAAVQMAGDLRTLVAEATC
jgi:hypothetical protein